MSYPIDPSNIKNLRDILSRKEFSQLKLNQEYLLDMKANENTLESEIQSGGNLRLFSQQNFVRNWINPETPFMRLLMKHSTGTGKTLGSLGIAMEFIKHFRQMAVFTEATPSVFVIGFSKHVFVKELLRHPEFGFISHEEMTEYEKLKKMADTGTQSDKDSLIDFEMRIKKRLSNKQLGGFFKFYGYKEFFNQLFIFSQDTTDKSKLSEEEIYDGIKSGWITLNYDLIKSVANSLIICDEIHNVYNSVEINNYGIALQMILDLYDSPSYISEKTIPVKELELLQNSVVKIVFMSATPINNNPTELIDLLNLLIPLSRLPGHQKLTKQTFFVDNRNLKKGALEEIKNMVRGYISFFHDFNPKYYPKHVIEGKEITLPAKVQKADSKERKQGEIVGPILTKIPYLKFIRCKMSPYHWKTYKEIYEGTLPPDGQTLVDMVLPNPDGKLGLFRTREITHGIGMATNKWKEHNQIEIVKQPVGNTEIDILTGEFMNIKNIGKYSAKFEQLMHDAIENIRTNGGKVMIIHQHVKMSGVLFIQEMFRRNGIIDEFSSPIDNTLCVRCGEPMSAHQELKSPKKTTTKSHEFKPVRSIILYGDIDKHSMDVSIEKYNSSDNLDGENFMFAIGSKMIKEAYNFIAVQHLWIVSPPNNIPALEQMYGRPIRKNSHVLLPPEKQVVYSRIYVSSTPDGSDLSYEEKRYYEKLKDYLVIQQINKIFNENAIDSVIHRDVIFPPKEIKTIMQSSKEGYIGNLYFEAPNELSISKIVNSTTSEIFHSDKEIEQILFIIKRLFIEQSPVWKYDDLWEMVQYPPFEIYVNSSTFSEDNFVIALESLVYSLEQQVDVYTTVTLESSMRDIDRLFDSLDKKIIKNGVDCQIIYKNGYYILFPNDNIFNTKSYISDEYKKDLNRMKQTAQLGLPIVETIGYPEIDLDGWFRFPEKVENTVFNITKYMKTSNISYNNMKYKFFSRFKNTPIYKLPISVEVYGMDFHTHLIEDAIQYVFRILTNTKEPRSELHEFYFKMLYFYDKLDMIVFADMIPEKYKEYISKSNIKIPDIYSGKKKYEILKEDHQYNAFLMTSIVKSATHTSSDFQIDRLNAFIDESRSPDKHIHSGKEIVKVFANMLPVGHFITKGVGVTIPKLYDPETNYCSMSTEFVEKHQVEGEENDLIIGYYEKNPTGIDVKFKVRPPIHKITKHIDSRMIERGSVCSTHKKEELFAIAKSLEINLDNVSIKEVCDLIKHELMYREIQSRRKAQHDTSKRKSRIRWFYLHFEQQPII
jgi:hypothetical protein